MSTALEALLSIVSSTRFRTFSQKKRDQGGERPLTVFIRPTKATYTPPPPPPRGKDRQLEKPDLLLPPPPSLSLRPSVSALGWASSVSSLFSSALGIPSPLFSLFFSPLLSFNRIRSERGKRAAAEGGPLWDGGRPESYRTIVIASYNTHYAELEGGRGKNKGTRGTRTLRHRGGGERNGREGIGGGEESEYKVKSPHIP